MLSAVIMSAIMVRASASECSEGECSDGIARTWMLWGYKDAVGIHLVLQWGVTSSFSICAFMLSIWDWTLCRKGAAAVAARSEVASPPTWA